MWLPRSREIKVRGRYWLLERGRYGGPPWEHCKGALRATTPSEGPSRDTKSWTDETRLHRTIRIEDAMCAYELSFGGNRQDGYSRIRGGWWVGYASGYACGVAAGPLITPHTIAHPSPVLQCTRLVASACHETCTHECNEAREKLSLGVKAKRALSSCCCNLA